MSRLDKVDIFLYNIIMKVRDLAYSAGILDGEGGIRVIAERRKRMKNDSPYIFYRLRIDVVNTDKRIMDYFLQNFGGTVCSNNYKYKGNKRIIWRWQLFGNQAIKFLKKISPYILLKKEQAMLAIEFNKRQKHFFASDRKTRIPPPEEEMARRKAFQIKMKILNNHVAYRNPPKNAENSNTY